EAHRSRNLRYRTWVRWWGRQVGPGNTQESAKQGIGLFRPPGHECRTATRPEDTANPFQPGSHGGKEHHSEVTGCGIEALRGKRKTGGARVNDIDVRQATVTHILPDGVDKHW